MTHRQKLRLLHDLAGGDVNKLKGEELASVVERVLGPNADYPRFVSECVLMRRRGVALAEFVVAYGTVPPDLSPFDVAALDMAQPYAMALRVRLGAETEAVVRGAPGSLEFYRTYTGDDAKTARRLQSEAQAQAALRKL